MDPKEELTDDKYDDDSLSHLNKDDDFTNGIMKNDNSDEVDEDDPFFWDEHE